jgi:FixJ family two-component response regulator
MEHEAPGEDPYMVNRPLVSVVDDDESVRESLPDLLQEFGFDVQTFASAEEFLTSEFLDRTQVLLLDITMPGMSGPELYQELRRQGRSLPVVFITANADDTIRPQLIGAGAVECLFKPFTDSALLEAVSAALRAA